MARRTAPPPGLGTAGRRLWSACLIQDESLTDSNNPRRHIVLEAARLADQLEKLAEIVENEGLMSGSRVHPALIAWRKSTALLARLIVSLRMPDPVTGKRPQRRSMRVQGPSGYR